MSNLIKKRFDRLKKLRWIARITSILFVAALLPIFFGGGNFNSNTKPVEWLELLYFPLGFTAGLVIGWKNDLIGGLISLLCIWIFYYVYVIEINDRFPSIAALPLFSIPAVLFLISGIYAYFAIGKLADKPAKN